MKSFVEARCPLRPGEKCSLCETGATGPHDCGLVYLTMSDPDLRELYTEQQQRIRGMASKRRAN